MGRGAAGGLCESYRGRVSSKGVPIPNPGSISFCTACSFVNHRYVEKIIYLSSETTLFYKNTSFGFCRNKNKLRSRGLNIYHQTPIKELAWVTYVSLVTRKNNSFGKIRRKILMIQLINAG